MKTTRKKEKKKGRPASSSPSTSALEEEGGYKDGSFPTLRGVMILVTVCILLYITTGQNRKESEDTLTFDDDDDAESRVLGREKQMNGRREGGVASSTSHNITNNHSGNTMAALNQENVASEASIRTPLILSNSSYIGKTVIVSMLVGPVMQDRYWSQLLAFEISLRRTGYDGEIHILYTEDVNIVRSPTKSIIFKQVDKITIEGVHTYIYIYIYICIYEYMLHVHILTTCMKNCN